MSDVQYEKSMGTLPVIGSETYPNTCANINSLQSELGSSPVSSLGVVSDSVTSSHSDPLRNRAVLLDLLAESSLKLERLNGTLWINIKHYKNRYRSSVMEGPDRLRQTLTPPITRKGSGRSFVCLGCHQVPENFSLNQSDYIPFDRLPEKNFRSSVIFAVGASHGIRK